MKKLLFVLSVILTIAACTKAPINGDLEGMWQLTRIETASDTITSAPRHYWSFQLKLLQLDRGQYFCRFEHKDGMLRVNEIVAGELNSAIDKGGAIECVVEEKDAHLLAPYGLFRLDTRFKVESLTSGYMRLRSDDACLYFRKY